MKHYTTVEQSKKLVELGLNPETADMGWNVFSDDSTRCLPINDWDLSKNGEGGTEFIPCWSLGALLEVMPEQITYSDFKPFPIGLFKGDKEKHSKYGHYWIQYFCTEEGGVYVQTNGHTPIEAAYNMVVWLLENNYIEKKNEMEL